MKGLPFPSPVGGVEVSVQGVFPSLFLEHGGEGEVPVQPVAAQDLGVDI